MSTHPDRDANPVNAERLLELSTDDLYASEVVVGKHVVRQLLVPASAVTLDLEDLSVGASGAYGSWTINDDEGEPGVTSLLFDPAEVAITWVGEQPMHPLDSVRASWKSASLFGEPDKPGSLRRPQIGAVHAALAHWLSGIGGPGLIVMPTGTGKTETMLALLAAERAERVLVLVPTVALREQIAAKFLRLGVLQTAGILPENCLRPSVLELRHGIQNLEEAQQLEAAQVIVATPQILSQGDTEAVAALLASCSHLFVDEAHHSPASTWGQAIAAFEGRKVLLFTATPHRRDRQSLPGRQIFRYTLAEAQRAGYYEHID